MKINEVRKLSGGDKILVVEFFPSNMVEMIEEAKKQGCKYLFNKVDNSVMSVEISY